MCNISKMSSIDSSTRDLNEEKLERNMVSELGYEESRKFNINRFLVVREAPRQTPQSVRFAERLGGFAVSSGCFAERSGCFAERMLLK